MRFSDNSKPRLASFLHHLVVDPCLPVPSRRVVRVGRKVVCRYIHLRSGEALIVSLLFIDQHRGIIVCLDA